MRFSCVDPPSHIPDDWLYRKNAFLPADDEHQPTVDENGNLVPAEVPNDKPCTGACCKTT